MRPIIEVAADRLGIPAEYVLPYGHYKAKISLDYLATLADRPDGKLILVTAITPTPAGEGKTTTTVGLGDALNLLGKKAMICIREPSLGPCFGVKGGAAGGGYAQVVPMEDINLHFTGDFHAIGAANNLLAALDRQPRLLGQQARHRHPPRDLAPRGGHERPGAARDRDLARRRGQRLPARGGLRHHRGQRRSWPFSASPPIWPICSGGSGRSRSGRRATRSRSRRATLSAAGPMAALLKDALAPNLVQTLENNPAFIHGGPFANIAHGCNSVIATKAALKLGDYVVTEAGFGADLGAEKFFDIKCRKAGLKPDCAVLVATIRALKMHGGVAKDDLKKENLAGAGEGLRQSRAARAESAALRRAGHRLDQPLQHRYRGRGGAAQASLRRDRRRMRARRSLGARRRGGARARPGRGAHHRDQAVAISTRFIPTTCR